MRRNRKRQSSLHAAGIALHRRIYESFDTGKFDDLVELAGNFHPAHAKNGAVEVHVFPPTELWMKTGTHLEQGTGSSIQTYFTGRRRRDLGDDLEQRALAGAVAANDADDLPLFDSEGDILQRPERLNVNRRIIIISRPAKQPLAPLGNEPGQKSGVSVMDPSKIFLADTKHLNCRTHALRPTSLTHWASRKNN